ncbi:MAG: cell division protein FtsK [Propionibacteriales bacterium]|nr:cell division protein FtsK [Propionibacteriales bacterium]
MTGKELERKPAYEVAVERWSVDVDDEAETLADDLNMEPGTVVAVDPSDNDTPEPGSELVPWRRRELERPPLVPTWLRDREERVAAARWYGRHAYHTSAYHVLRSPKYAGRVSSRAPIGLGRVVSTTARWVADTESRPLRQAAVDTRDTGEYLRLLMRHRETVRSRAALMSVLGLVGASMVFGLVMHPATPLLVQLGVLAAVVGVLGLAGRQPDKPVLDHAVVTPRARKLTADVVLRAFIAGGLCKENDPIQFPQPIQRDGNGWRAVIDLPWGVTAEQAIKRRDRIASGLDLDEVQVWLERVRGTTGSARRVGLWVADEDPYAKPSGRWPWAEQKAEASLFEPFPFGQDQRGRLIELLLMFTSVLVGAIPRMGKTLAARLLLLAAALDPYVEQHIFDGKGGRDWKPFEKIAHRFGLGVRSQVVQALRDDLLDLREEMNRRYDVLGTLPVELCPDGRITPRLARMKSKGLHPIVIGIDECQRYFEDPTYGDEIVTLLTELAKVGPAVGIILVLATQKPDEKSVPTRLRDVIGTRFALKTMTWQSSEAVLGAGSYSAGYDASRFQRAHKGVGLLLGADDTGYIEEGLTVRTFLGDGADIEKVIDRAHAARVNAGTLSGVAAGETPAQGEEISVLDDTRAVFAPGEDRLWSETILTRLVEQRPAFYTGWTPIQLSAALKPHGVTPEQVWGTTDDGHGANRRGFSRSALDDAHDNERNSP